MTHTHAAEESRPDSSPEPSIVPQPGHNPTAEPGDIADQGFREGYTISRDAVGEFEAALSAACDYRGDVTLKLTDGTQVEGFVFDRRTARDGRPAAIRMLPKDGTERVTIEEPRIARLDVTGKDTAAGKTFENWVRRYADRKLRGQSASIESESLEA